MRRKLMVFTGTRAEYGLLAGLMSRIRASGCLDLQVLVSGAHLSPEFGSTWKQIEADGFRIDAKVEMILSSDSRVGVVKSMGLGLVGFADALDRLNPDIVVVLGDRFEALALAQAALILGIPIAHVHGGEVTEGAYDDAMRHAITKMAWLHFTAAEPYRRRVIQMGEEQSRVFNVGALGLDHLFQSDSTDEKELSESLGFDITAPYFLVTYHPVTAAEESPQHATRAMLAALDKYPDYQMIITYPNADNGGRQIIDLVNAYAQKNSTRVCVLQSLGSRRYKTALRGAAAVIGNSSSGLIEAPSVGVPTVNIGARQRGRLCAESVVHCEPTEDAIAASIATVIKPEFGEAAKNAINPYGMGGAAEKIVAILESAKLGKTKSFNDLERQW